MAAFGLSQASNCPVTFDSASVHCDKSSPAPHCPWGRLALSPGPHLQPMAAPRIHITRPTLARHAPESLQTFRNSQSMPPAFGPPARLNTTTRKTYAAASRDRRLPPDPRPLLRRAPSVPLPLPTLSVIGLCATGGCC
ncbi:hypothetical protein ACCO45_007352 [Purpureocillium lilacinum]|uniref:Uncharacterized protein n=1 Tax=Purpureocillium lilacinum TaxID=33203 RepID=A0ACC4DS41_PURLI